MSYFPTYHTLNFFEDPNKILSIANKCEFIKSEDGRWPGKRTPNLGDIHTDFFNHLNAKILRLIFNRHTVYDILYNASVRFQKISYDDVQEINQKGWSHTDTRDMLTYIIYLSPDINDSGTSIQISKNFNEPIYTDVKKEFYKNTNSVNFDTYKNSRDKNNSQYETVAEFKSYFNSMLAFDSTNYHCADLNLKPGQERLTLIGFFHSIKSPYFPIPDMNRNYE